MRVAGRDRDAGGRLRPKRHRHVAITAFARAIAAPAVSGAGVIQALDATHLARWRGNCLIDFGDPATITDLTTALAEG